MSLWRCSVSVVVTGILTIGRKIFGYPKYYSPRVPHGGTKATQARLVWPGFHSWTQGEFADRSKNPVV